MPHYINVWSGAVCGGTVLFFAAEADTMLTLW